MGYMSARREIGEGVDGEAGMNNPPPPRYLSGRVSGGGGWIVPATVNYYPRIASEAKLSPTTRII
jgi:hypothetical protein